MVEFFTTQILATGAPPEGMSAWLSALGWLMALVLLALKIWETARGRPLVPQPLMTRAEADVATRKELEDAEQRLEAELVEIKGRLDDERNVARESLGKVHRRIDALVSSTSEMRGALKGVSDNVNLLVRLQMGGSPGTNPQT